MPTRDLSNLTHEEIDALFNDMPCSYCGFAKGVHGFGKNPADDPHVWAAPTTQTASMRELLKGRKPPATPSELLPAPKLKGKAR